MISDDPPPSYQSISVRDTEEEGEGANSGNATATAISMEPMEINTTDSALITRSSTPSSGSTFLWWYVIVLTLASSIGFYTLFQHQLVLENELQIYKSKVEAISTTVNLELHTVEHTIQSMNNNITQEINGMGGQIEGHSVDIHGLTKTGKSLPPSPPLSSLPFIEYGYCA